MKSRPKVIDCFLFFQEEELLDLRLNYLNDYVDYFVIIEGNKTWQNNPKKFRFDINKFLKFKDKIIYIIFLLDFLNYKNANLHHLLYY